MTSLKHLKDRITPGDRYLTRQDGETTVSGFWLVSSIESTGPIGYISNYADAMALFKAPDLLQLCEEMKEALDSVRRHGLIETDGYETTVKKVGSVLNKYNELFK